MNEVLTQQLSTNVMLEEQAVAVAQEQEAVTETAERNLWDRLLNTRPGKAGITLMATLAIGGVVESVNAHSANAHQSPKALVAHEAASANQSTKTTSNVSSTLGKSKSVKTSTGETPVAHESTGQWKVLGGDPLVPGGVHSRHDFVRLVISKKGKAALKRNGLNKTEVKAVTEAAHDGKEKACTMHYGDKFESMVFGINGTSRDRNVRFEDRHYKKHGAPAFCLDAEVKDKKGDVIEIVKTKTPKRCANLGVVKVEEVHPHKKQHPKKPQPQQSTQTIENITVVTTVLPPNTPNHPPTGRLAPPLHEYPNDTESICDTDIADQDGDPVTATFKFQDTTGNLVGQQVSDVYTQQVGTQCVEFKAPATPQQVNITSTLRDNHNNATNIFGTIPIVPEDFGGK